VWYIVRLGSSSWTFWYHTWLLPTLTWPPLANSRREWSTPTCDISLVLEHRAEHFDTSLDHLSKVVLEIFNFKNFPLQRSVRVTQKSLSERGFFKLWAAITFDSDDLGKWNFEDNNIFMIPINCNDLEKIQGHLHSEQEAFAKGIFQQHRGRH
jgi:hypothetical protein